MVIDLLTLISAVRGPGANVRRHHLLNCFRLNLELLQTGKSPARDIIRLEKINLACGEQWEWQELEQPRLDLGHRKGQRYE